MKTKATLLIFLISINTLLFSQTKVWNKQLKPIKTKGVYSIISKSQTQDPKGLNFLIPFAIKYGNYAIKRATSKKEKDFISESTCLNRQLIPFRSIEKSDVSIKSEQFFYKKGSVDIKPLTSYTFKFEKDESSLIIQLDEEAIEERFIPVKMKKKYDFLISNFEISIRGVVFVNLENDIKQKRIIDLGTITINKINPSFKSSKPEVLNSGKLILPKLTEKKEKITIESLIVKIKINHINPYGTSSSGLNDFLEKNSDTNEDLLNSIFSKK